MLDQLRDGDIVVVWKLDCLSRSLKDVLHIMERIAKAGAGFDHREHRHHHPSRAHDDADGGLLRGI